MSVKVPDLQKPAPIQCVSGERVPQGATALVVAFGVLQVAMLAARAIAPLLLTRFPFALAILDGRTSTTLLLVERMPTEWFVVGATLGFVLGDLLAFPIGRAYGLRATQVLNRWLPTTGKILALVERFMGTTKGAPLMVTSGYATVAVAGASGVGWWPFLLFNLTGVALRLCIVLHLARSFEDQFRMVGDCVDRYSVPLSLATVALVGVDLSMGRRRHNLDRERRSTE